MTICSLSPEALAKISALQWDRTIEKHEGPESWASVLSYYDPEFISIADRPVLLSISRDRHPNVTILRCDVRADGNSLTDFLKDTTHYPDPEDELF